MAQCGHGRGIAAVFSYVRLQSKNGVLSAAASGSLPAYCALIALRRRSRCYGTQATMEERVSWLGLVPGNAEAVQCG